MIQGVLDLSWEYILSALGLFAGTFVISIVVIGFLLVRLPANYFLDSHNRDLWIDHHPILQWSGVILKNLSAVALIIVGIVLCFLPGQGVLTILIGLALLDFPGKRRLERAILRKPGIFDRVNRLRHRYGRPPLVVEEPRPADDE